MKCTKYHDRQQKYQRDIAKHQEYSAVLLIVHRILTLLLEKEAAIKKNIL